MNRVTRLLISVVITTAAPLNAQQIDYNTQIKNKPSAIGFPVASDHIQFVSPNGSDANDGLSWASAKFTCGAAVAALNGTSDGIIIESPTLSGPNCIAVTGGASANAFIWAPNRFFLGPRGQATSQTSGIESRRAVWAGSVWDTTNLKAVDDRWEIYVEDFNGAFSAGSNFVLGHSSVSDGSGRILARSDFVVDSPITADAGHNSNSFAFDNQASWWDGSNGQQMLWEMANTVTPASGNPVTFRQNWVPIFLASCPGCSAEFALGGSGTNGLNGNYAGPPKWLFTHLNSSTFNTLTFEHSATSPRTKTFADATGIVPDLAGGTGQIQFVNSGATDLSANSTFVWDNVNARLGVGVASPAFGLDVNGRVNSSSAFVRGGVVAAAGKYLKSDGTTGYMDSNGSASGVGSCGSHQWASILNSDAAPTCTQPAFTDVSGTATASQVLAAGSAGQIQFNNTTLAADSNLFWDNTNKRLGIGQATPTVPLHLKTTASGGAMQLEIENSATGGTTWYTGSTDSGNGAGGGKYVINSSTSTGSAILTLDSATQNVGINQTSPARPLDVNGSANIAKALFTGINTVTFSATPTFDLNLGNTQTITLTGNVTSSTIANSAAGQIVAFIICQDATGSRTFVWPTQFHGAMTIGATASKCSAQDFVAKDASNYYALGPGAANQ